MNDNAGTLSKYHYGQAAKNGGQFYIAIGGASTLSLNLNAGSSFMYNSANENGGSIYVDLANALTMAAASVNIFRSQALNNGGFLYVHNTAGSSADVTFSEATTIN